MHLDLELRVRVHALDQWVAEHLGAGLVDATAGVRSLLVQVDGDRLDVQARGATPCGPAWPTWSTWTTTPFPSRVVHLPLSWDDPATREAIDRYMHGVRADAPWCPWNIEFIRRINGLDSVDDVHRIVFDASYLVLGLGDVYLGAPVATPLDPRHRLVTTKYNPARTWTPENAVGIGGAYLCIYGMEGPGGYQFVGRTVQVWNRDGAGPALRPTRGCCAPSTRSGGTRSAPTSCWSCGRRAGAWATGRCRSRTTDVPPGGAPERSWPSTATEIETFRDAAAGRVRRPSGGPGPRPVSSPRHRHERRLPRPRPPPSTAVLRADRARRPRRRSGSTLVDRDARARCARARWTRRRGAAARRSPLAGPTLAVKGNIDVAGLPTTAGCPAFADVPAPVTRRWSGPLVAAGAVVIGKTNLDQFATGLVGTRSPYGVCPNAHWDGLISGGSSSGSAVAVAAGHGRPRARHRHRRLRPRPGRGERDRRASSPRGAGSAPAGVVPGVPRRSTACRCSPGRSTSPPGRRRVAAGTRRRRPVEPPLLRRRTPGAPAGRSVSGSPARRRPRPSTATGPERAASRAAVDGRPRRHRRRGRSTWTSSRSWRAGRLLYDGAFVAERYAAVGDFVDAHPDDVDPVVGAIISAAGRLPAWRFAADLTTLPGPRGPRPEGVRRPSTCWWCRRCPASRPSPRCRPTRSG